MTDGFDQPASEFFKAADYNGHLILCENIGPRYTTNTSYGETDAINADVTVLTHPEGPKTFTNTAVFGAAMVGTLSRSNPGRPVLGRIGQGTAKTGQSAPWVLNGFDPATDGAFAQSWVDQRNAQRAAAGFGQPQAAPAPVAAPIPQAAPVPTVPQVPVAAPVPAAVPQVPVAAPAAVPQVPVAAPVAAPQVPVAAPAPVAVPQPAAPAPVAVAPGAITPEQLAALPPEVQAALAAQAQTPPY